MCVCELLNPNACFSCLFSLSSSMCIPVIHSHTQEMNPLIKKKKGKERKNNATQVGCLAKALEGRVCLSGTIEEHHLFCCDVHNLNRERSVESEERVSGERVGKTGGEREEMRMRETERDQVKRTE